MFIKQRFLEVVIAEDDDDDFLLLSEAFDEVGIAAPLVRARDGVELLDILEQKQIEPVSKICILLDLNMPRKNGKEVLLHLKKDRTLAKIPVIIFTTSTATKDIEFAYEFGANAYVSKPSNFTELISFVEAFNLFWLKNAIY